MTQQELSAEVATRTGVRLEPGDPAFALATLCEIVLGQVAKRMLSDVSSRLSSFEEAIERADQLGGQHLAQQVQDGATKIRAELKKDLNEAGLKAAHLVYEVDQAHRRPTWIRWFSAGLGAAIAVFLAGVWAGAYCFSHAASLK